jgi:hypothetical protein
VDDLWPTHAESFRDFGRADEVVEINRAAHVPTVTRRGDSLGPTVLRI